MAAKTPPGRFADQSHQAAHTLDKRGADGDTTTAERRWRLADLSKMAQDVFEDEEAAEVWLRTPNLVFHNTAPIDHLDTESGAMAVRQVLNAIDSGGAV
jgi:putative toxin-antitoxin system antitoxin component (TIGR02293 family)